MIDTAKAKKAIWSTIHTVCMMLIMLIGIAGILFLSSFLPTPLNLLFILVSACLFLFVVFYIT